MRRWIICATGSVYHCSTGYGTGGASHEVFTSFRDQGSFSGAQCSTTAPGDFTSPKLSSAAVCSLRNGVRTASEETALLTGSGATLVAPPPIYQTLPQTTPQHIKSSMQSNKILWTRSLHRRTKPFQRTSTAGCLCSLPSGNSPLFPNVPVIIELRNFSESKTDVRR